MGVGTNDKPLFSSSNSWEKITLLELCTVRAVMEVWGGVWIKKNHVCFVSLVVVLEWGISFLAIFSCGEL